MLVCRLGQIPSNELVQLEKSHGSNCAIKESWGLEAEGFSWSWRFLNSSSYPSKAPKNPAEAVAARRRLHDQGFTAHQRLAIAEAIAATSDDVVPRQEGD